MLPDNWKFKKLPVGEFSKYVQSFFLTNCKQFFFFLKNKTLYWAALTLLLYKESLEPFNDQKDFS